MSTISRERYLTIVGLIQVAKNQLDHVIEAFDKYDYAEISAGFFSSVERIKEAENEWRKNSLK